MPKSNRPRSTRELTIGTTAVAVFVVAVTVMFTWPKHTTAPTTTTADPSTVTITTADAVKLEATIKSPVRNTLSPAVILLHQYGQDRHQWDAYLQRFLDAGLVVLSYDMRGFGASRLKSIPADQQAHLQSLALDLPAVLAYVQTQPNVDQAHISIVGASIGADVAYLASGSHLGLYRTVLLSPVVRGTALDGHDVPGFSPTGVLGVASDAEQTDLTTFMSKVNEPKRTSVIPSDAHGMELLVQSKLLDDIIAWIKP